MSIEYCKLLLKKVVLPETDFVAATLEVSSGILPLTPSKVAHPYGYSVVLVIKI